ncbi:MAG: hypothetical protein ACKOQ3_07370 [Novosphingobium sp.]
MTIRPPSEDKFFAGLVLLDRRIRHFLAGFVLLAGMGHSPAFAQAGPTTFASRWTAVPVERLAPDTLAKEGTSLLKLKLLSDSIYQLDAAYVSKDGKWKLPVQTELDGMVSQLPVACTQTERRKAKYSIWSGSYFESTNICLVDSNNDGSFDKVFEQSGFGLRWMTFDQAVNDGRKNDNRMSVDGVVPANATPIIPVHYSKIQPENSRNLLYLNIFYAANHSLVGEFSLGFCIDYKALTKACSGLRPMTFLRSFKKTEIPATFSMIGSQFTLRRFVDGKLDVTLDQVPERHVITIIKNPFNIE